MARRMCWQGSGMLTPTRTSDVTVVRDGVQPRVRQGWGTSTQDLHTTLNFGDHRFPFATLSACPTLWCVSRSGGNLIHS
jgi:hypothetical protein